MGSRRPSSPRQPRVQLIVQEMQVAHSRCSDLGRGSRPSSPWSFGASARSTFSSLPAAEGAAGARPPLAGAAQPCSAVQVSQLGSCTGSSGPQVRIFGPQLGSQQVIFKAILQIPHGILQKSNEEKGIIWSIFQMGKQGL